jgi:uncharacterized membrane protein
MTSWVQRLSERSRLGLLTLLPILFLLLLLIVLPPDGNERGPLAQFIGRFHPLAVHLPIGLILLVPILELVGRHPRFPYLHQSADFVVGLATLSAIAAAAFGWCLGRSGGYSGPLVTQHMWGGLFLSLLCWTCWMLSSRTNDGQRGVLYPIALTTTIALMIWTGYRGGQLVRGEDHFTEVMPSGMRKVFRVTLASERISATPDGTFYGTRIQPIFKGHCITCHGGNKHKSNLRVDNYSSLMRGSKHGPVVKAANLHGSELFRRITLSPSDDDFMPKGKRPLSADEVKLIELWIAAGASNTLPVDAIKAAPTRERPTPEITFETVDAAAITKERAGLASMVATLQRQYPNVLDYESRASANLVLNASLWGDRFRDADVAALAPIAGRVVVADFSRTAITDQSAPTISSMKRLRVLRLTNTKITDATVRTLSGCEQLESLSVFGTAVTPASLQPLTRLSKLRHAYVGGTAIRADAGIPDALKNKILF